MFKGYAQRINLLQYSTVKIIRFPSHEGNYKEILFLSSPVSAGDIPQ